VNDPDQAVTWYRRGGLQERLSAYEDAPSGEERSAADLPGGLVSIGFLVGALRRSALVWCLCAIAGLLIGSALYLKFPPAYQATTTVLLVDNATQDPQVEVKTDTSLAQSQAVASRVVHALKLPQSAANFQAAYTVTPTTDTVLTLNIGAPSAAAAKQQVSALAAAFLQYRAQYARTQQQQLFTQLDQQYSAAQQRLKVLEAQVSQMPNAPTGAQKAEYDNLQTQMGLQKQIMQYVTSSKATAKTNTNAMVTGSYVLNSATVLPRSHVKGPALYVVGGLLAGAVLGMGGIMIAALLSRRLHRRDEVAAVLGAPVRLSVGPLRSRRLSLPLPRRAAKRKLDMKRVVMHLRSAVPSGSLGPASLAVVAIDDARAVARAVASLAASYAGEGKQVVMADLSGGAYLARPLGVTDPGIHKVSQNGTDLMVFLPEPEDFAPVGPVPGEASPAVSAQISTALATACSSANLLLTLAVLDPAFSGDHLGTWATKAVAVVTAGESSAEKIHSVGEMIRLAGTRLDSVVLLGADKRDESTGLIDQAQQSALANPV
jgi:capsular polysaccharide biosynthesis protein